MKCDTCLNYCRAVISENGLHFICGLSDRAANNCIMGKKDHYTATESQFRDATKKIEEDKS